MMYPDQIAKSGTEHAIQAAFFAWVNFAKVYGLDLAVPYGEGRLMMNELKSVPSRDEWKNPELDLCHAIPNGGGRSKVEASKLKAEGVKPGIPDTFLPVPKEFSYPVPSLTGQYVGATRQAWYMGLYLEFKRAKYVNHKNGGQSEAQLETFNALRAQGYCCRLAYSWQEAANLLLLYYGNEKRISTRDTNDSS